MLKAVFYQKNGEFCGCSVSGHAGYADHGQDIVCAAVSSAVQFAANLITETFRESADITAEGDAVIIQLDGGRTSPSVLEALCVHLQCISEEFPDTIKFEFAEV